MTQPKQQGGQAVNSKKVREKEKVLKIWRKNISDGTSGEKKYKNEILCYNLWNTHCMFSFKILFSTEKQEEKANSQIYQSLIPQQWFSNLFGLWVWWKIKAFWRLLCGSCNTRTLDCNTINSIPGFVLPLSVSFGISFQGSMFGYCWC